MEETDGQRYRWTERQMDRETDMMKLMVAFAIAQILQKKMGDGITQVAP